MAFRMMPCKVTVTASSFLKWVRSTFIYSVLIKYTCALCACFQTTQGQVMEDVIF